MNTEKITTFKHYCICGGFAWKMEETAPEQPHTLWCPQFEEYAEWYQQQSKLKHQSPIDLLNNQKF